MVAGDLVNTASRIQSAAEPGTVLVGEATRRASEAAIAYEDAGAHELKGKAEPVPLWRARARHRRARRALRSAGLEAPFVGRERELRLVKELFHASRRGAPARSSSRSSASPGIGKSRLAWEFEKYIDGLAERRLLAPRPLPRLRRRRRVLGARRDGAHARADRREEDPPTTRGRSCARRSSSIVPDAEERAWVEPRLAHLLGLDEREAPTTEDLFAAWRLFFERLADRRPSCWCSRTCSGPTPACSTSSSTCSTGRARIRSSSSRWRGPSSPSGGPASARRSATRPTLSLEPLADEAMERAARRLRPGAARRAAQAQILARAEGVPLYAVETVRMLLDRGLLAGRRRSTGRPARSDARGARDAARARRGAARRPGAGRARASCRTRSCSARPSQGARLAALTGRSGARSSSRCSCSLVRKEVLSVQADPRSPERGQYGFLQDLLRRVAYETLSRADAESAAPRGRAHLETTCAERGGRSRRARTTSTRTRRRRGRRRGGIAARAGRAAPTRAGERAASSGRARRRALYREGCRARRRAGWRGHGCSRPGQAASFGYRYEEAIAVRPGDRALQRGGATHAAARALRPSGSRWGRLGDLDGGADRLAQALAVLADEEPDADIAALIEIIGTVAVLPGRYRRRARKGRPRARDCRGARAVPECSCDASTRRTWFFRHRGAIWSAGPARTRRSRLRRARRDMSSAAPSTTTSGVMLTRRGQRVKASLANASEGRIARRTRAARRRAAVHRRACLGFVPSSAIGSQPRPGAFSSTRRGHIRCCSAPPATSFSRCRGATSRRPAQHSRGSARTSKAQMRDSGRAP